MSFSGQFPVLGTAALIFLIIFALKWLLRPRKADIPKYTLRSSVLTRSELGTFHSLRTMLPADTHLIIKPRMFDILDPGPNGFQTTGFQRVIQKHFDFVIIETNTGKPLLAIELDDPSHLRESRQRRDHFVNTICERSNFPLLRINNQTALTTEQLTQVINRVA